MPLQLPLNHRPLKRKLFTTAPLIAVLFSVVIAVVSLRLNLIKDAENFREEFARQNSSLMARGDVASIRRHLEAMSVINHLVCIEGQTKHTVFFKRAKKSCHDGLISRKITITSAKNPGLKISATMMIRKSHLVLAGILISVQVALLLLLSHASRLLQAETLEHEVDRSRAFAALTTMLAHDVRRPLAVTKMAVDMLKSAGSMAAVKQLSKKIIPEIERASIGVEGLIMDVMELGRDNEISFYRSGIRIDELIKESLDHVLAYKNKSALDIEVDIDSSWIILGNEFRLKRVFSNLIDNAIDAATPKGKVILTAETVRGKIRLKIANTRSFIEESEREKIFDLFYTSGKPEGTGLGLAIARKIITAHGGFIYCRSWRDFENPFGRTEFIVTLPLADKVDQSTSSEVWPQDERPRRVAIIDDSVISVEAWTKALCADVVVETFDSPEEFFQAINTQPEKLSRFEMVLTDYYFDDSRYNGQHVASFVYDKGYEVPVVLTSCVEPNSQIQNHFDAFVDKNPTNYETLLQKLRV